GTPIINQPEVAILGTGKTQQRPVVRDGQIVVREMMYLALSFDHRVIDGADAARFVNTVIRYLESPELLLLEM
ncbi:MAG: 2-oxo acid dehydrogenase subunit E2, partial [Cyanobacteria bacterium REEB65]|nr:2-oxo acid dehydrogenase subunit E2 [Cyanobacteria bacterium REEB65]